MNPSSRVDWLTSTLSLHLVLVQGSPDMTDLRHYWILRMWLVARAGLLVPCVCQAEKLLQNIVVQITSYGRDTRVLISANLNLRSVTCESKWLKCNAPGRYHMRVYFHSNQINTHSPAQCIISWKQDGGKKKGKHQSGFSGWSLIWHTVTGKKCQKETEKKALDATSSRRKWRCKLKNP